MQRGLDLERSICWVRLRRSVLQLTIDEAMRDMRHRRCRVRGHCDKTSSISTFYRPLETSPTAGKQSVAAGGLKPGLKKKKSGWLTCSWGQNLWSHFRIRHGDLGESFELNWAKIESHQRVVENSVLDAQFWIVSHFQASGDGAESLRLEGEPAERSHVTDSLWRCS